VEGSGGGVESSTYPEKLKAVTQADTHVNRGAGTAMLRPKEILSMALPALWFVLPTGCCEPMRAEAILLVAEYSTCLPGDECVAYSYSDISSGCPVFMCSAALNSSRNLDLFTMRATIIAEQWNALCPFGVDASCAGRSYAECNVATGFCEFSDTGTNTNENLSRIAVEPQVVRFGILSSGQSLAIEVAIGSVGEHTLYVEDIELTGPDVFRFDDDQTNRILAPGSETTVVVYCEPTGETNSSGGLVITSNDSSRPDYGVPLTCASTEIPY